MAATVRLNSFFGSDQVIYLSNGGDATPWDGTGTPWDTFATTPFEIGMNDATGERFVIPAPPRAPILSGAPPFSPWGQAIGYQHTNRTVVIPIQARAESQGDLGALLGVIRRVLFDSLMRAQLYLTVQITGGATVAMLVESGSLQEGAQFWNEEDGNGVVRGMLTLECRIGVGAEDTTFNEDTFTNAVPQTSGMAALSGDWRYLGQPHSLSLSGGDIAVAGAKVVYCAVTADTADSGALSESLSTSSSSASTSTGAVTFVQSGVRRAVRYRCIAQITSPNSALEVRALVTYGSGGATVYTGPWIAPGSSTTIVDLGYVIPGIQDDLVNLRLRLQFRSSGGAASGTLARLRLLGYYTFCKITPPNATATNDTMSIESASPGNWQNTLTEHPARAFVSAGSPTQQCVIVGQSPVAIEGAGLWLAWTTGGVFDPADTITVTGSYLPLYETIGT